MVFGNPINIATATIEEIYERLCWLYATLRSTFVYDAIGNCYQLSDITQMTRGKIPYPEQFVNKFDYEQNSLIQDLQTKDFLCTKSDWINCGRKYLTMADQRDFKGQELYNSIEGVPLREPAVTAARMIRQL